MVTFLVAPAKVSIFCVSKKYFHEYFRLFHDLARSALFCSPHIQYFCRIAVICNKSNVQKANETDNDRDARPRTLRGEGARTVGYDRQPGDGLRDRAERTGRIAPEDCHPTHAARRDHRANQAHTEEIPATDKRRSTWRRRHHSRFESRQDPHARGQRREARRKERTRAEHSIAIPHQGQPPQDEAQHLRRQRRRLRGDGRGDGLHDARLDEVLRRPREAREAEDIRTRHLQQ